MPTVETAPTVLLNPGAVWKMDHAGVWRLSASPHGDYTVRYSGFDYVVERDGGRTARRLTLQAARQAAEEDFNERVEAACRAATEAAQTEPETANATIPRNVAVQALTAALALTADILPDPTKSQQDVAQATIDTIGDLLGLQPAEYNPYLTKET